MAGQAWSLEKTLISMRNISGNAPAKCTDFIPGRKDNLESLSAFLFQGPKSSLDQSLMFPLKPTINHIKLGSAFIFQPCLGLQN